MQQIYESNSQLNNFCQTSTDSKCLDVSFKGEGSIDAGGPFRETITNIASELMSPVLPLLIKSPNNKNDFGNFRDCYILNPASVTPATERMYKMLGAFLGYSFLSKSPLPINLAPFVWKQILQEQLSLTDLDDIDSYSVQVLRELQQHGPILSDEEFDMQGQVFATILSNGEEVDLIPDGSMTPVTKARMQEFIDLTLQKRFEEGQDAVKHIREGIKCALNNDLSILTFVTPQSFDTRATGEKHIEVDRLKSITTFNVGNDHEIAKRFWRVFEQMSYDERAAYLKFVWGRNRLPVSLKNLSYKHEVRMMTDLNKIGFPQAHTCFFQLDIPNYADDEICYKRLVEASTFCGEIDTDGTATEDLD